MGNSVVRTINYKPRYTPMEAFDLLPREVREALSTAVTQWDASWFVRRLKSNKITVSDAIRIIAKTDKNYVDTTPWEKVPFKPSIPSPCKVLGISPLYSTYKVKA